MRYDDYLDSHQIASILIDKQHRFVKDLRYGVNPATLVDAWIKRGLHRDGLVTSNRICSVMGALGMVFTRCTE